MKSLERHVKILMSLDEDSGVKTNHVSKVLAEFKVHELVECIYSEVRKGKFYMLTDKGNVILNNLKKHI